MKKGYCDYSSKEEKIEMPRFYTAGAVKKASSSTKFLLIPNKIVRLLNITALNGDDYEVIIKKVRR